MRLTRWDQAFSTSYSNEVLFLLSRWHLAQTSDGEQANDIRKLVELQDISGLCHYSLSYDCDLGDVRHLRQVLAFFTARADVDIGINTAEVAWNKAIKAEALCKQTNELFRVYAQGGFYFPLDVESVLYRAQRKIASILGDLPSLSQLKLRFGPGATTQVKKKDASVRRKLSQMFSCSEDALPLLPELLCELPLWSGLPLDDKSVTVPVRVHPGVVDFVPKSAKTDRTISKEPMLNTMVQLGIGDYIADRLRLEGVDIRDQTLNQRLACEGSIYGDLATLDLSSASDTIATKLVESLLPEEWFDFLRTFRTGGAETPDGYQRLEKFSSMGNGFTFPLETLIFYALTLSSCDESDRSRVNVYGDDIIVPTYAAPLLIKTLTSCGFIINLDKSFVSGPFRESCGKDYYTGIDVRPCYIKDALSGISLFKLHNFYVRSGMLEPSQILLDYVDVSIRIWGPDGFGDGHLLGDTTFEPHKRDLGWGGWTFETYTFKQRRAFYRLGADHVYPSYSIYAKEDPSNGSLSLSCPSQGFLRTRRSHGAFRPERADAIYARKPGGNDKNEDRKSVV